jgi:hypothetical protein
MHAPTLEAIHLVHLKDWSHMFTMAREFWTSVVVQGCS